MSREQWSREHQHETRSEDDEDHNDHAALPSSSAVERSTFNNATWSSSSPLTVERTTYPIQSVREEFSTTATSSASMDDPRPGLGNPIINYDVVLDNLAPSVVEDYIRQAKEAFVEYYPEGRDPLVAETDQSMVFVAHGVTESVFDRHFLPVKARYFLDENGDLYIRKFPGQCHGKLHGHIIVDIGQWFGVYGLDNAFEVSDAGNGQYGKTRAEPDIGIHAVSDGGGSSPRAIVEIEVAHRSTRGSRDQAGRYFLNPSVRLVMLVKVWKRRAGDGGFAAACVLWRKDAHDNISCQEAHDFGSRPIHETARNNFTAEAAPDDRPVPVVPHDTVFAEPHPGRAVGDRTPQIITMPVGLIIVNVSNENGDMFANLIPPPGDIEIDLSRCARIIEMELPQAQLGNKVEDDD